ncbi:hypothetical protein cyc_05435 [Cyclospora cayetanensis]|uniref:5'-3' exonuclease n=1 Tax=Cyclospora cayetanensis TaxID=88456 RepID=A0A1D3CXH3_9EIME|nr:hypothetical protein cyc_05435 [Cyclospora cayetanensis]
MGIGRFYRWLSERYPLINEKIDASSIPAFDNLYLDMNGILHNCSHGNSGGMLHANENLMWQSVFSALDLVISTISPRKLLYLAADGVAPRAKMNQQRARRYRAAKSAAEAAAAEENLRRADAMSDAKGQGAGSCSARKAAHTVKGFDSNCISPGTEFMASFFRHLRFFCEKKLNEDQRWRGLKVLLSGPDVPGEGEHKIMAYLRCCKAAGNADPNTRHCLYGLDADLIMLSLASHEPQFALLREEVIFGRQTTVDAADRMLYNPEKLQLLHISLLREYLVIDLLPEKVAYSLHQRQLQASTQQRQVSENVSSSTSNGSDAVSLPPNQKLETRIHPNIETMLSLASERERVIDDFVIFCFLAGNDFLPHTFSTDIGEKGLDTMIACYRRFLAEYRVLAAPLTSVTPDDGPWLVRRCGQLNLLNLYIFLNLFVSTVEDPKVEGKASDMQWLRQKRGGRELEEEMELYASCGDASAAFRARFYQRKLNFAVFKPEGQAKLQHLCQSYLEGLQWVAYYYFRGCDGSGWRWYYPYHYAPFMHDVLRCSVFNPSGVYGEVYSSSSATCGFPERVAEAAEFDRAYLVNRTISLPDGSPYSPFMQLLSILPPQSANLLPEELRPLLLNPPAELAHAFPRDFEIDMEGVKVPWGGVTLLPFVDEATLERIVLPLLRRLRPDVLRRNIVGRVVLLMRDETSSVKQGRRFNNAVTSLASADAVYDCECFFFKHKVISRSLDILVDVPSVLAQVQGCCTEADSEGFSSEAEAASSHNSVFPSSLPSIFPDVLNSCVLEEEVLVLPPPFVARLDERKAHSLLTLLSLSHTDCSDYSRCNPREAADAHVAQICSFLKTQGAVLLPSEKRKSDKAALPQLPSPDMHPQDTELLFPTMPLPGASPDAAALTPSLYALCFAWHYGSGVKVFRRESANQSVVMSTMPFPRQQLQQRSARTLIDLLQPEAALLKLLDSKFVLYDFPFVKLASPVAIWLPTIYYPLEERPRGERSSEVPCAPTEQLQAVETEKRRLQLQGIAVADELEAFSFFEQHATRAQWRSQAAAAMARNKAAEEQPRTAVATYWHPDQQILGGSHTDEAEARSKEAGGAAAAQQPPTEVQLQQLAMALTRALPGTQQQQMARECHPSTALSTVLVELLPVEDVVLEERLVGAAEQLAREGCSSGSERLAAARLDAKTTPCAHFRYSAQTVYRLLPLIAQPSKALVESLQQCHQEVLEAVAAHKTHRWRVGEDVLCIFSSAAKLAGYRLLRGVTGVLADPPDEEGKKPLSVHVAAARRGETPDFQRSLQDACKAICAATRVRSPSSAFCFSRCVCIALSARRFVEARPPESLAATWLKDEAEMHTLEQAAALMGVTPFAAYCIFSSVFVKEGDNLYIACTPLAVAPDAGVGGVPQRRSPIAVEVRSMQHASLHGEDSRTWEAASGCLSGAEKRPRRVLTQLQKELERQNAKLPQAESVVLRVANESCCCVRAADLLSIQKHILAGFLRLRGVQHNGLGEYTFIFAVQMQLAWQVQNRVRLVSAWQETATLRSERDAQRILSQLNTQDKLDLFQQQMAYLDDVCIEVLLDESCLGASDGDGRISALRMLRAPASQWLPLCVGEQPPPAAATQAMLSQEDPSKMKTPAALAALAARDQENGRSEQAHYPEEQYVADSLHPRANEHAEESTISLEKGLQHLRQASSRDKPPPPSSSATCPPNQQPRGLAAKADALLAVLGVKATNTSAKTTQKALMEADICGNAATPPPTGAACSGSRGHLPQQAGMSSQAEGRPEKTEAHARQQPHRLDVKAQALLAALGVSRRAPPHDANEKS